MGHDDPNPEMLALMEEAMTAHRAGVTLPLVRAQSIALWHRWHATFHGGGTANFRAFWGAEDGAVFAAYQDRSGAALVALWRAGGTRALDTAALRLLAATEMN